MRARRRSLRVLVVAALASASLMATTPTYAAPTWMPIDTLSALGRNAFDPQVVLDPLGNATAVWARDNGSNTIVQAASRPAGGTWSTPRNLSATAASAYRPQVVVDPAGTATAIWGRLDGTHLIIQAASRPLGGVWTATQDLSAPGKDASDPQVAVDGSGNATAIWSRPADTGTDVILQVANRPAGGEWTSPTDLGSPGLDLTHPQIAVDPAGNATAVWTLSDDVPNHSIQAAHRPVGGAWTVPADLTVPGGANAANPQVAVDASGTATAVWQRWAGTHYIVEASSRSMAGAWTSPHEIISASPEGHTALPPQVAVDAAGNATATWLRSTDAPGAYDVQVASRPAGGAWTGPVDLSGTAQDAGRPHVAVGASGHATVVWSDIDGSTAIIRSASRAPGGGWGAPTQLSGPTQAFENSLSPQIAVDATGNAAATWTRFVDGNYVVQARGLDFAGPVVSSFSVPTSGTPGAALSFSVAANDAWSTVSSINWDFGDGTTASGSAVSHTYGAAGARTVTVTLTDAVGNTTVRTAPVTITSPTPTPPVSQPVTPPPTPQVTTFTLNPKTIRAAGSDSTAPEVSKAKLVLTGAAQVTLVCKKKGSAKVAARIVKALPAGTSLIRIKAKIGRKTLTPGTYRVTVTARNAAGTSSPVTRKLTVVR